MYSDVVESSQVNHMVTRNARWQMVASTSLLASSLG